jgi:hypothetical protein
VKLNDQYLYKEKYLNAWCSTLSLSYMINESLRHIIHEGCVYVKINKVRDKTKDAVSTYFINIHGVILQSWEISI